MTWLDLVFFGVIALLTALGAKRRWSGFVVGVGALILFRLLLVLFTGNAWVGLAFALLAGVLLGFLGRALAAARRGHARLSSVLGGLGGALLGLLTVLAFATSLPIERNVNGQLVYPPQRLPQSLRAAVTASTFIDLGRDILLYPLLVEAGMREPSGILQGLHGFFVVGEPWKGAKS